MPKNVKITTIISPMDLLFPHSCQGCGRLGSPLCDRCKNYIKNLPVPNICPNCKRPRNDFSCRHCKNLPDFYYLGEKSGPLGNLIKTYKYSSVRALAKEFASLLDAKLPNISGPVAIVPLPTASHHLRSRGFDHIGLIAKHLAKLRHYQVVHPLIRAKNTVQVGTDEKTRQIQADAAYVIKPGFRPNNATTYLLLDDVWTTGASMTSAVNKLKKTGTQKIAIATLVINHL